MLSYSLFFLVYNYHILVQDASHSESHYTFGNTY